MSATCSGCTGVADLVAVRVAVDVGDDVKVAVDVGVRVLLCVGVDVCVNVFVAVAVNVFVDSVVRVFVGTSDEAIETRVGVGCDVMLLQLARNSALNNTNRKTNRRIFFLS